MGIVKIPKPVMFFASIIYKDEGMLGVAIDALEEKIGDIHEKTQRMAFDHTDYYSGEMGDSLCRILVLFEPLMPREYLIETKLTTNSIEMDLSGGEKRKINIDPGYITLENVILATTKNYTHRIYMGSGIYADLTLIFKKGTYTPLEWTYPDYAGSEIISILNRWRGYYKRMLA
ncbi:MAG TPA: DUF4416 family protein [Syntrophorhabdaceae bacterium]|nr:DUF4416 family protein [Syntrophorhabdaceae bacterium]HOL05364.1 DUF4416 family protein [Syntrophorhabdaceae bacterium]HPP41710.1 DUF4416 family protein [Syntrophorhabdaceae bacterium]